MDNKEIGEQHKIKLKRFIKKLYKTFESNEVKRILI